MENLLVILIVASAAIYLIRRFWKSSRGNTGCSCGCGGSTCDSGADCNIEKTKASKEYQSLLHVEKEERK